jgi:hypothetical protein
MTWIKTVSPREDPAVGEAMQKQRGLYPPEYSVDPHLEARVPLAVADASIVASHSLLPDTLYHAFATFGTLMDPALPLTRRQHEMIAATVSALNRCFY